MNDYNPESWVIIRIINDKTDNVLYKVFGSWRGGFATGDNWRLNSGITKIEEQEKRYLVFGYSGSIYYCYKKSEGSPMGSYNSGILEHLLKQLNYKDGITAEVVKITEAKPHLEIQIEEDRTGHRDNNGSQEDPYVRNEGH